MTDEKVPWTKTRNVLERGGPWEVLPEDLDFFKSHARAYCASPRIHPDAKARINRVWLDGRGYEPGWQGETPLPAAHKLPPRPEPKTETADETIFG